MKHLLTVLLLTWACIALPAMGQTRAWLDRSAIHYGETVALNIETDQPLQQWDDAPLRQLVDVGGQRVQRQFELVNGHGRSRTVVSMGLRPRAPGVILIPALRIGNATTLPIRLTVLPPAVQQASATSDVFVETHVDAATPYVQQAVGVTVRLNFAVPLVSGQLDLDAPDHASLQQVGEDATYQHTIGGREFRVVERRYLLIPERSGELILPGARFNGIAASDSMDSLLDGNRKPLAAASANQHLQVRPIPAGATQPWLPLHDLRLRYLGQPATAVVGQATTVDVEVVADGATAAQLPAIEWTAVEGVQVLAEPAQVDEQLVNGRPQTTVRRRFALLPSKAGTWVLTGPQLPWWDAEQGVARVAALPPLTLQVKVGVGGATATALRPMTGGAAAPATAPSATVTPRDANWGWWLLAVLLAAGLCGWRWQRQTVATSDVRAAVKVPTLQQGLQRGNLTDIARALCAAAEVPEGDLERVVRRLESVQQAAAVGLLQSTSWGQGDAAVALAALRTAFTAAPTWKQTNQRAQSLLPPLYPE